MWEPAAECCWKTTCVLCLAAQKTALIVYAHQSDGSFNAAVRDTTVQELSKQGYNVVVSDLYAMNFKASATQDDLIGELCLSHPRDLFVLTFTLKKYAKI